MHRMNPEKAQANQLFSAHAHASGLNNTPKRREQISRLAMILLQPLGKSPFLVKSRITENGSFFTSLPVPGTYLPTYLPTMSPLQSTITKTESFFKILQILTQALHHMGKRKKESKSVTLLIRTF